MNVYNYKHSILCPTVTNLTFFDEILNHTCHKLAMFQTGWVVVIYINFTVCQKY